MSTPSEHRRCCPPSSTSSFLHFRRTLRLHCRAIYIHVALSRGNFLQSRLSQPTGAYPILRSIIEPASCGGRDRRPSALPSVLVLNIPPFATPPHPTPINFYSVNVLNSRNVPLRAYKQVNQDMSHNVREQTTPHELKLNCPSPRGGNSPLSENEVA